MIYFKGVFFVVMLDGQFLGCVGFKGWGDGQVEIKWFWMFEVVWGLGFVMCLMECCDVVVWDLGIKVLWLDINFVLFEVVWFYEKFGWVEIDRFNDDFYLDLFFEKCLEQSKMVLCKWQVCFESIFKGDWIILMLKFYFKVCEIKNNFVDIVYVNEIQVKNLNYSIVNYCYCIC